MSMPRLVTGIVFVFAVGAMGYGAFAVLAEGAPGASATGTPAPLDHAAVARGRETGQERIESPRECRHEAGIHNACTHM
jgi:hypothetical protein